MITARFINAIMVQFIKPIFEGDFVEKGMKAWLVDVEWNSNCKYYRLYFGMTLHDKIEAMENKL